MHRIDNPSASSVLPPSKPAGPGGFFTAGNIAVGQDPTIVEFDWLNNLQEELVTIVVSAGIPLDKTNNGQVLAALRTLFAPQADLSNYVTRAEMNAALANYVLLSQMAYAVQAGDQLQQYFPHSVFQCGYASVPAGFPAPIATVVNLPVPFPSACDAVLISFAGTTPAATDACSAAPLNNAQIEIGAGAQAGGSVGVVYLAIGH